ncbi:MAG: hypothetical protein CMJ49_10845 [Planctomycetaceae bacterium]|nr:hypothetical protein [Planctomycetaceae bacterium]
MLDAFRSVDDGMGLWYLDPAQYRDGDNKDSALLGNSECDVLAAYMAAFRATGDVHWLDRLEEHARIVLSMRDDLHDPPFKDYRGESSAAWTTHDANYVTEPKNYAFIVESGNITFPLADFAQMVDSQKALKEKYGETAALFAERVAETLRHHDEQWVTTKVGDLEVGYYVARKDADFLNGIQPGKPLPTNYHTSIGRTHIMMWLATGEERYKKKAELIGAFVQLELVKLESGALIWYYWPRMEYMPLDTVVNGGNVDAEDVSHATITIEFMALARRHLQIYSDETMAGLAKMFTDQVYIDNARYHFLIDGTWPGTRGVYTLGGFMYLAEHNRRIGEMVRGMLIDGLGAHAKPEGAAGFKSTAQIMAYLSQSKR